MIMKLVLLAFIGTDTQGYRMFPQGLHPNCFRLLASLARPSSSLQTTVTPQCPVLSSGAQSGVLHLLGLIRGGIEGAGGSPFRPWWFKLTLETLKGFTKLSFSKAGCRSGKLISERRLGSP